MLGHFNALIHSGLKVSFKLETLESLLCQKVSASLKKYKSDLVIGNLIQTRYTEIFVGTLIKQEKEGNEEKVNNDLININRVTKNKNSANIEQDMVKFFIQLMQKSG